MRIEKNMTEEETEKKCLEQARIDAIRRAFGDALIQGNSTYISNQVTGEKVESQNVFQFYSDTYVNGEWIKDLETPVVKKRDQNGERWIDVSVNCKVRELKTSAVHFKAAALTCPERTCETESFNDGQDFYLYFKSPVDGYISVYLDVPNDQTTYRILPYQKYKSETSFFVKADQDYYFFSKKHDYTGDKTAIDELVMSLTNKGIIENNKVFLLFSPGKPLEKPILNTEAVTKAQQEIILENYDLPAHLSSDEFQKWQLQVRSRNKDIEFNAFYISIQPLKK